MRKHKFKLETKFKAGEAIKFIYYKQEYLRVIEEVIVTFKITTIKIKYKIRLDNYKKLFEEEELQQLIIK